jgi:hypothetical protein
MAGVPFTNEGGVMSSVHTLIEYIAIALQQHSA